MEVPLAPPQRSSPALTAGAWAVGILAGLDALVGLWAVRGVYRSTMTPDISDIDGEYFDPHGVISLMTLCIAAVTVAALPPLLATFTSVWRLRRGDDARGATSAVLALGGLFWAVLGVLAVWLDTAGAQLFDPLMGEPKGMSLLRPLGYLMIVVGAVCAVHFGRRQAGRQSVVRR